MEFVIFMGGGNIIKYTLWVNYISLFSMFRNTIPISKFKDNVPVNVLRIQRETSRRRIDEIHCSLFTKAMSLTWVGPVVIYGTFF